MAVDTPLEPGAAQDRPDPAAPGAPTTGRATEDRPRTCPPSRSAPSSAGGPGPPGAGTAHRTVARARRGRERGGHGRTDARPAGGRTVGSDWGPRRAQPARPTRWRPGTGADDVDATGAGAIAPPEPRPSRSSGASPQRVPAEPPAHRATRPSGHARQPAPERPHGNPRRTAGRHRRSRAAGSGGPPTRRPRTRAAGPGRLRAVQRAPPAPPDTRRRPGRRRWAGPDAHDRGSAARPEPLTTGPGVKPGTA